MISIIRESVTDDATLASTPAATLPVNNLQVSDRGAIYRVTGDVATITANLTTAAVIGGCVLWRHNLLTTASWRVRVWDGANQTGALVYDSGEMDALAPKALGDLIWGVDPLGAALDGYDFSFHLFDRNYVGVSLQIDIDAPAQATIDLSRLFVGSLLTLTHTESWGASLAWQRETLRQRTASGGLRVEAGKRYRVMDLDLPLIAGEERPAYAELLRQAGSGKEIWISTRTEQQGSLLADHAMLGYMTDDAPLVFAEGGVYQHKLTIEES